MNQFFKIITIGSFLLLTGCAKDHDLNITELSASEIEALETQAQSFRGAFFQKDYMTAIGGYESLLNDMTVSSPLYLLEQATAYWANGDKETARKKLLSAELMLRGFYDAKSEESAMSYWGSESEKVYKGDPYEQSLLYIFLGLLLLDNGDIDNALASFKSAQLADSDSSSELYRSDFGLAQFLEAYCYKLRDQSDSYQTSFAQAVHSFQITHPTLRSLVNKQQHTLSAEEDDTKNGVVHKTERLEALSEEIEAQLHKVDLNYISPLNSDFNTLLVIWNGKSPIKQRVGEFGEQLVTIKNPTLINRYEVQVDNTYWVDGLKGLSDVSYQATTRGGRQMDDVLADQAAFKKASYQTGNVLVTAGAAVALASANAGSGEGAIIGMGVGGGMMLLGGIAYGVGSLTSVEADIRSWQLLPNELMVVPLALEPGEHRFNIDGFEGFIPRTNYSVTANISNQKPLNVILAIPNN